MQVLKRSALLLGSAALGTTLLFSFQQPDLDVFGGDNIPGVGQPGGPRSELSGPELAQFKRGRKLFDADMHKSQGLGLFELNADSCRACHSDPVMGGAGPLEVNVSRFGFDDDGAGPFMNLPGGQAASKLVPSFSGVHREEIPPEADVFEQRNTPTLLGMGPIDEIFESSILANEDPTDMNGDGVFGVARIVDPGTGDEVGRFGWKAQIPTLKDFVKDALGQENGITTPADGRGFAVTSDNDTVLDPEFDQPKVDDIAFFLTNLAPPQRKGGSVAVGEALFGTIGCATCHVPSLGSPSGPVPLYSDLLLHDVMPAGFRGMGEPGADVGFYRTPPLWGIGETAPYMHDGRAEDLRGAILAHFSEGENAKNDFLALSPGDQDELIAFLEDL